MRWEKAASNSENEVYHLYKDDRKILTLSLHPFSNSARIEIDKEKRVVLIRKEGFRKKKIVLRSEYGIKIGELGHESKQDYIDMNGDRLYYAIRNNPLAEFVLFKSSIDKPVASCNLNPESGKTSVAFSKQAPETFANSSLLMALCWYLFIPSATETIPAPTA